MNSKKLIFIFGLFIFLIFSCRKIIEPIINSNYKIVFTSNREEKYDLYKIDLNTLNIVQLTFDGKSTSAQRAPDNKTIYYNSNGDICRMDLDGTNKINLTNSASFEYEFSISKDGEEIAFVSDRDQTPNELYRTEIYLMNTDDGLPRRISFSKYYSESPDFSSDNNTIAYESFDYDSVRFSIHLYSIIDSSDAVITPKGSSQGFPVFSPDGKYLSYYSWDDHKLYLLNLKTMNRKAIIFGDEQKFSLDGRYLYFLSTGVGGLDVFRYDISNDKTENITHSPGQENAFDFTPDNRKIVTSTYIDNDSLSYSQIFIKNIDSDIIKRLTEDNFNNYKPVIFSN